MAHREPDKLVSAALSASEGRGEEPLPGPSGGDLAAAPPPTRWEDWMEPDPSVSRPPAPRKTRKVPFACDGCGAGCGLLATVDLTQSAVVRVEGNPLHPAS